MGSMEHYAIVYDLCYFDNVFVNLIFYFKSGQAGFFLPFLPQKKYTVKYKVGVMIGGEDCANEHLITAS